MAKDELSFDEFDEINFPRPELTEFDKVVEAAMSRRGFMGGLMTFGVGTFLVGTSGLVSPAEAAAHGDRFGFEAIPANTDDTITVPPGFNWDILVEWGQPMWSDSIPFDDATRGTAESQARAFGDNTDGMAIFEQGGATVLAVNNEYTNRSITWGNRPEGKWENADDVMKGKLAHGVSVIEIAEGENGWEVVMDSAFNRRITPDTEMEITGPAAGHDLMKTTADPTGTKTLGTWNNCGNGQTPWGTYLACEENFNGYFSSSDPDLEIPANHQRYGLGHEDWGYGWASVDDRFDLAKDMNEPHRAGYIVEIDPLDPNSTPRKHTAMGRFKHENAEIVINGDGRIVAYMGDDERGEFLYRFVSDGVYSAVGDNSGLLASGTLYAAKFTEDQRGEWLPLTEEATGMSAAENAIFSRVAASKMGATTMDRPEWVTANPSKAEVYVALTNNRNRGVKPNAGGDDTSVNGPNPRAENHYGQIVRWLPDGGDHTADGFDWDIYALAGNPTVHTDAYAGSDNINEANMFNSPDGLAFDQNGILWIQTDGNYSNEENFAGMGNNQMLAGDTATGEIRRFLVGPNECEVTGICWSADRRTMFVGIQHPGERGNSHFPHGGESVPRSVIITVKRDDGGLMG